MSHADAIVPAVLALARYNVPHDVQELLVFGDPARNVKPGALSAAITAAIECARPAPKQYECPVCGSHDIYQYHRCERPDCTDGRDPR